MKHYKLFDLVSPEGEYYEVDEETGEAWCVNAELKGHVPAFPKSSAAKGTTPFEELVDYASKYGTLEELV